MAIDKKIDYVEQDGSLNFVKNSESVTVPKKFKARKEAPAVKLAYITDAEAKMLKKQKPGTPHKGPKGIPSYDSYGSIDSSGRDVGMSGAATSAAERGGGSGADARELAVESQRVRSGPDLPPGVVDKNVQDYRDAFIAAGGGRRVNPGFFDSRDTVSPAELARAKAFNPAAFRAGRRGGIMDFFTGGGFLGNLIRGIGQKFGLGKRFNQPTYDMRQFSGINPTFQNDLGNEGLLSLLENEEEETDRPLRTSTFFDDPSIDRVGSSNRFMVPFEGARTIIRNPNFSGDINIPFGGTVLEDEFSSTRIPEMRDLGNPYADPRIVPEERGLEPGPTPFTLEDRIREEGSKLGIGSDFDKDLEDYLSQAGNQGIMKLADALTIPTFDDSGVSLRKRMTLYNAGYNDRQIKEALDDGYLDQLVRDIEGPPIA